MDMAAEGSHSHDREEGVLKDVLDELDRERSRRAELEEQVRKLQEDASIQSNKRAQQARAQNSEAHQNISHRVFVSLETEVKGYQQIVDALTLGKPAIAAAAAAERSEESVSKGTSTRQRLGQTEKRKLNNANRKTLPLHVVRLLEVLPWDPRAEQHIFAVEEIFEWQVYQDKAWQSQLRFFPTAFKTLPLVKAEASSKAPADKNLADQSYDFIVGSHEKKDHRSFLSFLAGGDMQSPAKSIQRNKNRILTNERVTALYDLEAGYPLPSIDGGVWEWVGSWRVGSRASTGSTTDELYNHKRVDSDQHGWSYVVEPQDFLLGLSDMIWDNPGIVDDATPTRSNRSKDDAATPTRPYRRRRWMRERVLVDYLYASKFTQQYLKLLAENARLSVAAGKISDQLVETKLALTETEEKLEQTNDLVLRKSATLRAAGITDEYVDLKVSKKIDDELGMDSIRSTQSVDSKFPDPRADFSFKFSQWVQSTQIRKSSEDNTSLDESVEESSLLDNSNSARGGTPQDPLPSPAEKFDWKKIGRGNLLHKLKAPNTTGSNPGRSGAQFLTRGNSAKSPSIFRKGASSEANDVSAANEPKSMS